MSDEKIDKNKPGNNSLESIHNTRSKGKIYFGPEVINDNLFKKKKNKAINSLSSKKPLEQIIEQPEIQSVITSTPARNFSKSSIKENTTIPGDSVVKSLSKVIERFEETKDLIDFEASGVTKVVESSEGWYCAETNRIEKEKFENRLDELFKKAQETVERLETENEIENIEKAEFLQSLVQEKETVITEVQKEYFEGGYVIESSPELQNLFNNHRGQSFWGGFAKVWSNLPSFASVNRNQPAKTQTEILIQQETEGVKSPIFKINIKSENRPNFGQFRDNNPQLTDDESEKTSESGTQSDELEIVQNTVLDNDISQELQGLRIEDPSNCNNTTVHTFNYYNSGNMAFNNSRIGGGGGGIPLEQINWMKMQELNSRTSYLSEICKNIQMYHGKIADLTRFRMDCEAALGYAGPELEKHLVEVIVRTKLNHEVKSEMQEDRFETVNDLIRALRAAASKVKTYSMLIGELFNMYQANDESVRSYVKRLKEKMNQIEEVHIPQPGENVRIFKNEVKNLGKQAFKAGIVQHLEDHLDWDKDFKELSKDAIAREEGLNQKKIFRREEEATPKKVVRLHVCQMCDKEGHIAKECPKNRLQVKTVQAVGVSTQQTPAGEKIKCQICDKTNHIAKNCFRLLTCEECGKKGHSIERCIAKKTPSVICQLCDKSGHIAEHCHLMTKKVEQAETCQLCQAKGHNAKLCKKNPANQQPTRFEPTTPRAPSNYMNDRRCHYCGNTGHFIRECEKKRYDEQGNAKASLLSRRDEHEN